MYDFTITGPLKHANQYLEKMIKFWRETGKNLYSFILSLDEKEILKILDGWDLDLYDEKTKSNINECAEIGRSLAIIAYGIEKGKDTGEFITTTEELCEAVYAFFVLMNCAIAEKSKKIKVIDNSYFFNPKARLSIEFNKPMNDK